MDDLEKKLTELEHKVDALIRRYQEVVAENTIMRKKLADLIRNKAQLENLQTKVEGKIKAIVANIKEEAK